MVSEHLQKTLTSLLLAAAMSLIAATSSSPIPTQVGTATTAFTIKLNSKNYLSWKTQFRPLLNLHNFHGLIDGTSIAPAATIPTSATDTTPIPNPAYAEWFKKDQQLHSWLLSSLSEEVFPFVIGLKSSYEVWHALTNAFGSVSQNRQLQIHIELQELKRADLTVSQFLQKAKALADELNAAGRPLSPAEFNAVIYRNIGQEYHPIITALNLHPTPVDFYELHGHLVAHEILLNSANSPIANYSFRPPHASAPLLPTPFSVTPRPRQQFPRPPNNMSNFNRGRPTCQICGYRNHTAITCRRRYHRSTSLEQPARPATTPTANMATATTPSTAPWYIDTSANYHIQPDVQNLHTVNEYTGSDHLVVGNGQGLQISHTGTGTLFTPSHSLALNNVLCVPNIQKKLLSVQKFTTDNSVFFEFWPNFFIVKDQRTK
jgi:hypothetical protein